MIVDLARTVHRGLVGRGKSDGSYTRCGWCVSMVTSDGTGALWFTKPGSRVNCAHDVAAGSACRARARYRCSASLVSRVNPVTRQSTCRRCCDVCSTYEGGGTSRHLPMAARADSPP